MMVIDKAMMGKFNYLDVLKILPQLLHLNFAKKPQLGKPLIIPRLTVSEYNKKLLEQHKYLTIDKPAINPYSSFRTA